MSKSVTTLVRRATLLPCLPGCAVDHAAEIARGRLVQECYVTEQVGTAHSTVSDATTLVEATGATEGTDRYPAVVLSRLDLPEHTITEMTADQAREFAALLLAAADRADTLAGVLPLDAA